MEEFDDLKYIVSKIDLDRPSMSFTNNVMRIVEVKEIRWTFSYFMKYVFPFTIIGISIISILILNFFGYRLPGLVDLLPKNISTYVIEFNHYRQMFIIGTSTIFTTLLFVKKQLKNKYIKL